MIIFKFALFFYLKEYRIMTGNNYRNAVIIGFTPEAVRLKDLFETSKKIIDISKFFGIFFQIKNQIRILQEN